MALELKEQIKEHLNKSNNILITFKKDYNADSLASALALKLLLEKMKKNVAIVCDHFTPEKQFHFLPHVHCIEGKLEGVKHFKICLNLKETPLKDFSYNVINDQLHIILTPKKGVFKPDHLKTEDGKYSFDLIITIDTEDLESLGQIFNENADMFYQTNIINLDHKAENEEYGQINHIDLNSTAVSEIIFKLFEEIAPSLLDQDVAQCLLCGIIAKTKSFKTINVTPHTLHVASRLMKLGADRDEIVRHLYYTKSISVLKLWGKVLARLKSDENYQLAWSFLEEKDLAETKANNDKLREVIEELIITAPEAKIIVIFYQQGKEVKGIIYSDTVYNSTELVTNYNPFGSKRLAHFHVPTNDLLTAGKQVIKEIKTKVKPTQS